MELDDQSVLSLDGTSMAMPYSIVSGNWIFSLKTSMNVPTSRKCIRCYSEHLGFSALMVMLKLETALPGEEISM